LSNSSEYVNGTIDTSNKTERVIQTTIYRTGTRNWSGKHIRAVEQ